MLPNVGITTPYEGLKIGAKSKGGPRGQSILTKSEDEGGEARPRVLLGIARQGKQGWKKVGLATTFSPREEDRGRWGWLQRLRYPSPTAIHHPFQSGLPFSLPRTPTRQTHPPTRLGAAGCLAQFPTSMAPRAQTRHHPSHDVSPQYSQTGPPKYPT